MESMLNEPRTYGMECCKEIVSGRKIASAIRPFVCVIGLQLECTRVLYEGVLVSVMWSSETLLLMGSKK